MSMKLWTIIFFLPMFFAVILPAINVWRVDVNMQWNHPFHPDGYYIGFNERRQKTNYLASHAPLPIDTLFLGSSRTTYIDPAWTGTDYGFNYGVSGGNYKDYEKYFTFAQSCSSEEIKNVWLELSFFQVLDSENKTFDDANLCIDDAKNLNYKILTMFSNDSIKLTDKHMLEFNTTNVEKLSDAYTIKDGIFQSYKNKDKFWYDNNKEKHDAEIYRQLKVYDDMKFYKHQYDEQFAVRLKELRSSLTGRNIIVYMPPVTTEFLKQSVDYDELANRERFLREAVDAFGEVWDFAYPNEITYDRENFQDAHHAKISTLKDMVKIIMEHNDINKQKYLVNKYNLEEHLQKVRQCMKEIP